MSMELDKATRLAESAQVQEPWLRKIERQIRKMPPVLQILAALFIFAVIGACIGLTWWEATNAAGGFVMLGKGVADWRVAWFAGFSCTIGCIVFFRITAEMLREHRAISPKVIKPGLAALIFGGLSALGVFANLVDNASDNNSLSKEQSTDRAILLADYRALKARVDGFDEIQMTAMVDADVRAHKAMLAEAAGWGMSDLDPDGACLADLKTRQRQLCNQVNGPDGVLSSISQGQAALESHKTAKASLLLAEAALANAPRAESADFWDQAAKTAGGEQDGDTFLVFFMLALTIGILAATCFGWDVILEYLEGRQTKKETA